MVDKFSPETLTGIRTFSRRSFLGLLAAGSAGLAVACTTATEEASQSQSAPPKPEQRVVALNTGQLDNLLTLGILPVGVAYAKGADLIPQYIREARIC